MLIGFLLIFFAGLCWVGVGISVSFCSARSWNYNLVQGLSYLGATLICAALVMEKGLLSGSWDVPGWGIRMGSAEDLKKPFNLKLGNVSANSKLSIRIKEKNKNRTSFDLFCRVTAFSYSAAPRDALNILDPSPDAPFLPFAPDGNPKLPLLTNYYADTMQMIRQKPEIVLFGGALACGFKSSKQYRELSRQMNFFDAGNVDTNESVVLWKIGNSVIDLFPPETVIIESGGMISYSPEKNAGFVHNMIRCVKRKSPRSKIILTGIVPNKPRSAAYPVSREKELSFVVNRRLKEIAQQENVIFRNCEEDFLDKDGKLRQDLYYSVFLSEEGYRIWSGSFLGDLVPAPDGRGK